jgi:hypothetical protein
LCWAQSTRLWVLGLDVFPAMGCGGSGANPTPSHLTPDAATRLPFPSRCPLPQVRSLLSNPPPLHACFPRPAGSVSSAAALLPIRPRTERRPPR